VFFYSRVTEIRKLLQLVMVFVHSLLHYVAFADYSV